MLNYIVKWVNENKADEDKRIKRKIDKKAKAAQFLNDHIIAKLQPKVEKKDVQTKERARWELIQKTFRERRNKERELIGAKNTKDELVKKLRA